MGLKKFFPIIFLLITLSLIGIIYIQINWILTMVQNKREELYSKLVYSLNAVTQELVEQRAAGQGKVLRLKPGVPWRPNDPFTMELMRVPLVAERFSAEDVGDKIRKAFNKVGLKNIRFEFSISSDLGNSGLAFHPPELQSKFYLQEIQDTAGKQFIFLPLQAPESTDVSNTLPDEVLGVIIPDFKDIVLGEMHIMIVGAIFFTLVIIAAFYTTLNALLRQKKLSEIKNDFINNMTHEFKTPLATISLAVDALRNEKVFYDKQKSDYFSGIIKEENRRMNKQVEAILQAALLEKQELQFNLQPVHVHGIIHDVFDNFQLQLQEKQGKVDLQLNARNDLLEADEVHFTNLISNLVDNAIKYSKDQIAIKVTSHNT